MFFVKDVRLYRPLVLATSRQTVRAGYSEIHGFGGILNSLVRDREAETELGRGHRRIPREIG